MGNQATSAMSMGWNAAAGNSAAEWENNRNKEKQTRAGLSDIRGAGYGNQGDTAYGIKGDVTGKYWDLYNQAGADQGGGPGRLELAEYKPYEVKMNEAMEGYRELSRNGGWTPEDIASAQSIASASGEGLYQGLKNQMLRSSAGSGVPVYGGTLDRMSRDSAQQANKANMESNMSVQSDIRNRKETGLEGVGKYDTEFQGNTKEELYRKAQYDKERAAAISSHNSAVAGYGSAKAASRRREQAGYLSDIAGLNNDLPYYNLTEGAIGAGTDILGSRKNPHDSAKI